MSALITSPDYIFDGLQEEYALSSAEISFLRAAYEYDFACESTSMDYSVVQDLHEASENLKNSNLSLEREAFLNGIRATLRYF